MILPNDDLHYKQLSGRRSADPLESVAPAAFSVRIVRLDGVERRSPHRHPHSREFIYVVAGRGVLWENGKARPFVEGDCALIEPGVSHATLPDAGTSMELVCFFPHPDLSANTEELPDVMASRSDGETDATPDIADR